MTDWMKEQEAEIQERCDAAAKGPWETGSSIYETVDWEVSGPYARGADGRQTIALIVGGLEDENAKKIRDRDLAEFIAHARTDLPDALKEIKRLREELRIAENSWNFEEGKRIIAQRDKAEGKVIELQDKLHATEDALDASEAEVKRLCNESGQRAQEKETHCATCGGKWRKSHTFPGTQYHICSR